MCGICFKECGLNSSIADWHEPLLNSGHGCYSCQDTVYITYRNSDDLWPLKMALYDRGLLVKELLISTLLLNSNILNYPHGGEGLEQYIIMKANQPGNVYLWNKTINYTVLWQNGLFYHLYNSLFICLKELG